MKKNGVRNVIKNYKNEVKIETAIKDIFVKIVREMKLEKNRLYLK